MIWLHIPTPFTSPLISKLDRRHTERLRKEERQLADGRGGGGRGGRGAESYDRKKAWSFKNHSILSGFLLFIVFDDDIKNNTTLVVADNSH
jgi:hypothetical protein